jgi:lipoate-protein ligase B
MDLPLNVNADLGYFDNIPCGIRGAVTTLNVELSVDKAEKLRSKKILKHLKFTLIRTVHKPTRIK